ncbi:MAG: PrsW family glutamic-type intramembrane protease [Candidatus Thalassarchaeaceae archaeon]|nr:PrsW family glutamic-type intramembrane protease [Candidatus Thalassarchaeaceae archaeon]
MLSCAAQIMQPGSPQGPHSYQAPIATQHIPMMTAIPQGMTLVTPEPVPLSPAPPNLQMARPSRPWRMYGRVVALVIILFLFEIFLFDGWINTIYGDSLYGAISLICAIPFMLGVIAMRRPRAVLLERAVPDPSGQQLHVITSQSGSLQTPMLTRLDRHLMRDDSVLDVPSSSAAWIVFTITVLCSGGLWYMLYVGNVGAQLIATLLLIPAIIIGFSIPVMGWWSHSTKRIGLPTRRRDAEAWLIAGILSAIPALFINSWIFLELVLLFDPDISVTGFERLGAVISAPIGEELCKAGAIWFFASKIRSPKHGFQIGFTVGLGFAILENLMYIVGTAGFPLTMLVRGIGSIPGHAIWTGTTGAGMGWVLMQGRATELKIAAEAGYRIKPPEAEDAQWKLIDKESGKVIQTPGSDAESGVVVGPSGVEIWMPSAPILQKEPWIKIPLPQSIGVGLIFAIMGHASWNGIVTIFEIFGEGSSMSELTFLILYLLLTAMMIAAVWIIGTGLLHSVREAPDGSEIDEYQAQLAELTQQRL